MVAVHPPGLDRLLALRPVLAGAVAALFTVLVLGTALVLVALVAPLLERCPWEKGQRFVRPGSHRGGLDAWSMRAETRTRPVPGGATVTCLADLAHAPAPQRGLCACWHLRSSHLGGACTFQNCGCPRARWSWSLAGGVGWLLSWLRGAR